MVGGTTVEPVVAVVEPELGVGRMPTALSRAWILSARASAGRTAESPSASKEGGTGGGGEAMLRQVQQLLFADLLLATRQCSSNTHSGKVQSR